MQVTLRTNNFQPISLIDLHQVKKTYLKEYNPYLMRVGKFIKNQFKETAFYSFFLIASADPG